MKSLVRATLSAIVLGSAGLILMGATPGAAEAVSNQVLAGTSVIPASGNQCPAIRIKFNFRVRYSSHFPINGGRVLRIKVQPLDRNGAASNILTARESAFVPTIPGIDIRSITFEANGSGPSLSVAFSRRVEYKVSQGSDFSSILVHLGGTQASKSCLASLASAPAPSGNDTVATGKSGRPAASTAQPKSIAKNNKQMFQDARSAITKKDYRKAARILTKLINSPPHKYRAKAQELLGVVRERNGQIAHAKAEYKIYLRNYPKGEGVKRVRQRLAAISTVEAEPRKKLRKAGATPKNARVTKGGRVNTKTEANGLTARIEQPERDQRKPRKIEDPLAYKSTFYGTVSQYYNFNQGFTRLKELESRRTTKDDDIFQNSILSSLTMQGTSENADYKFKWRFSGAHEGDFTKDYENRYRVSSAYAEVVIKDIGSRVKLGRQTRNTGGILGRFDGGLFSWNYDDNTTVNVTVGSPVDSSKDLPFLYNRYFYGLSVDLKDIFGTWDMTVYATEQRVDSLVDRRAIGTELRYNDERINVFASIDYDLYFNRVNSALVTGSYLFTDDSTLSASIDYVNSPSLSLSNALQGQVSDNLSALRNIYSLAAIKELAVDRTTETWSANLAYSMSLDDMWQLTVDGTVFSTGGNPASGGIAAIAAPGTEFFTSAQLVGSGVFNPRDIVSATLRYANTSSSNLYLFDTYIRYPFGKDWRFRPRAKLGYRELKRTGGSEIFFIPSVTANYRFSKSTSFEIEAGGRWSSRDTAVGAETNMEYYMIGGFRYQF